MGHGGCLQRVPSPKESEYPIGNAVDNYKEKKASGWMYVAEPWRSDYGESDEYESQDEL